MLIELINSFYPDGFNCKLCGAECVQDARGLCAACAETLALAAQPPTPKGLEAVSAGLAYKGAVKQAVMRFKYEEAKYLAPFFAQFMAVEPEWGVEALIPVPLHISRERERGYNQSLLLARELSAACGIPVDDACLVRTRRTATQTGYSAAARRKNVRRAFECRGFVGYEAVALVDDVCTTGSTLAQCAAALRGVGVERVYAVTACHA